MASRLEDELYRSFESIMADQAAAVSGTLRAAEQLAKSIQMEASPQGGLGVYIPPPAHSGEASASNSSSGQSGGESATMLVLKSGFGILPLVAGLFGLFGGGGKEESPPLVKYSMPPALDIESALTPSGLVNADYDQMGRPRTFSGGSEAQRTESRGASPAQITVNVQAMDARSFLDRSSDIAAAVRNAMLNLNSINDVVTDL